MGEVTDAVGLEQHLGNDWRFFRLHATGGQQRGDGVVQAGGVDTGHGLFSE